MTKISHFNAQIQIINQLYKDQALIEVIDACRELMKGFPKSKLLYDLRIFEFDKLERYNDAEQCFRQIINNDPDNAEHCNGLAVFLTKQNKIEEAISVYKKSISIDPDYFKPLSNLDDALQKKG